MSPWKTSGWSHHWSLTLSIRYWFQSITESCNWFPSNFNRNYLNYWFAISIFKALFLRSKINNKFNNNINNNINISRKKPWNHSSLFCNWNKTSLYKGETKPFFQRPFFCMILFPFCFSHKALPFSQRPCHFQTEMLCLFHKDCFISTKSIPYFLRFQGHTLFSKVPQRLLCLFSQRLCSPKPYLIF